MTCESNSPTLAAIVRPHARRPATAASAAPRGVFQPLPLPLLTDAEPLMWRRVPSPAALCGFAYASSPPRSSVALTRGARPLTT